MESIMLQNNQKYDLRLNLPKIPMSTPLSINDNDNKQNTPILSNIRSHKALDIKKLYYQYKSNARLLQQSPYSNNKSRKKIIEILSLKRYQLSDLNSSDKVPRKTYFQLTLKDKKNQLQNNKKLILVHLFYGKSKYKYKFYVANSAELNQMLKIQFDKIQSKAKKIYNNSFQKNTIIIGFQTVIENAEFDYILSKDNLILPVSQINLKPIFGTKKENKVNLSDFKIKKCLGSGGFSTVFLGRANFNNQYYAIKLIDKKFILDTHRQGIVQNQRYILGLLKSQFVTQLQFCFQTKNHFVIVIQYCPGGQLFYQLKKVRKMTQQQAKFYFLEILVGLDYIHSKHIIYRDLKPQNLLLGADGHIKIADYGLSKPIQNEKDLSYSFCGSPEYMAPQMLLKTGHNKNLDYYCLGALLYQLVVGVPPYYSTNHEQIYDSILNQQLSFPYHAQLSRQLVDLLQGLLCKNVNQRLGTLFGIKQILFHPWIGKIKKQTIQEKLLPPPFLPNPTQFNFDKNQIKENSPQFNAKLNQDIEVKDNFETHFNDQFYYEHQSYKTIKPKMKSMRCKKYKSTQKSNIQKQNKIIRSKKLKRDFSLTGFHINKSISTR